MYEVRDWDGGVGKVIGYWTLPQCWIDGDTVVDIGDDIGNTGYLANRDPLTGLGGMA